VQGLLAGFGTRGDVQAPTAFQRVTQGSALRERATALAGEVTRDSVAKRVALLER
jgi:hypothetical protein